jgi:hypothetical protein
MTIGARTAAAAALMTFAVLSAAHADDGDAINTVLPPITVVATGVSNMEAASAGDIGQQQILSQPLLRPAAILENVPGLIVTQHSGEGKANQYFLRAFNLDHGTDLASEIDDVPINMPTHAHGQGYTDLNFLIPELAADLHYKKGPYYADEGDFATAGTVRIELLDALPATATLGVGQDGYRRALAMGSVRLGGGSLLAAGEAYHNDGPFDLPDDYRRLNGVLRYHAGSDQDYWTLTGMAYSGRWNATDQVPERAIDDGMIDRFGNLAPTDGGRSSRYSASFSRVRRTDADQIQFSAYVIRYQLDLWSTFTYDLKDPLNGDQMLQHDDRFVYGLKLSKTWYTSLNGLPMSNLVGLQGRLDDILDVGIFPTYQRAIIGTTQNAGVTEGSGAIYAENSLQWRTDVRTVVGLRADLFDFDVRDRMLGRDGSCSIRSDPLGCDTGTRRASIFSPKFGLELGPWWKTRWFFNIADGYHSNDARGVTRSGQNPAVPAVTPLARAVSGELGLSSSPLPQWQTTLDVFELKLKSELVFDGDAGVTAPSGATTRIGVEWGNRYHINAWLSAELNAAVTRARFDQDASPDDLGCSDAAPSHPCAGRIDIVGRYVPNSPTDVIDAAITAQRDSGWFGALRARHFGASPLVEDGSVRSPPYTTVDGQLGFRSGTHWLGALDVFNLFNVKWNDIEYFYVSRLPNEAYATPDYIVHPGVPRTLRAHIQYYL